MNASVRSAPNGFFEELSVRALSPGWAKRTPAMWPAPRSIFVPTVWRYSDALAALTKATEFVSPEFAERRNLIMVNPIENNSYPTCKNLVAAYQLVLPGETARSHRHSPNALRLVLDAEEGAFTLVNGTRIDMAPGDVVLTPAWQWHGHRNESAAPAFWVDFLDVPLVQNLENMFFQHHPDQIETVRATDPASPLRYRGEDVLARCRRDEAVTLGAEVMRTIGLHVQGFARGERMERDAGVDNSIYTVTSGTAAFEVESLGRVVLSRGDVIVVPSWVRVAVEGTAEWSAVLRVTDAPVYEALGFFDVSKSPGTSA